MGRAGKREFGFFLAALILVALVYSQDEVAPPPEPRATPSPRVSPEGRVSYAFFTDTWDGNQRSTSRMLLEREQMSVEGVALGDERKQVLQTLGQPLNQVYEGEPTPRLLTFESRGTGFASETLVGTDENGIVTYVRGHRLEQSRNRVGSDALLTRDPRLQALLGHDIATQLNNAPDRTWTRDQLKIFIGRDQTLTFQLGERP